MGFVKREFPIFDFYLRIVEWCTMLSFCLDMSRTKSSKLKIMLKHLNGYIEENIRDLIPFQFYAS